MLHNPVFTNQSIGVMVIGMNMQKAISSKTTFVVAFLVSFALGLLVVTHLKHTVYAAMFGAPSQATDYQATADQPPQIAQAATEETGGCGCPLCCAL